MTYDPELDIHIDDDGLIQEPSLTAKLKTACKYAVGVTIPAAVGATLGYLYSKIPVDHFMDSLPKSKNPSVIDIGAIQQSIEITKFYTKAFAYTGALAGAIVTRFILDSRLRKKVRILKSNDYTLNEIIQETGRGYKKIELILLDLIDYS